MKNKYYKKLIELESKNKVSYDIGHRGGNYGITASTALEIIGCNEDLTHLMAKMFGAYSNYLGDGIRGAICITTFSKDIPTKWTDELEKLAKACELRFQEIENGAGLNDEEGADGIPIGMPLDLIEVEKPELNQPTKMIKPNKENFINVLVDCKGYSEEDAQETAKEYRNDLESFIRDIGGDDDAIKECEAYLA